jgi:recombination protein RecA
MAKPGKKAQQSSALVTEEQDDFTAELISSINKEHGHQIAYNLSTDAAPTVVKRWISTSSRLLDYAIGNARDRGVPEGRIIEIFGPPSTGKSHIALQLCKTVQKMGGIVIYIDTENATSVENLHTMGIDVKKKFVYIETSCTEDVFSVIESTILKAKALNKDVPIIVVWDSVAATSPKEELLGEYDKSTIGLQARVISKGMRKITGVIGVNNVTLVCLNQTRMKIGVMFGDPTTTSGGNAIPFHASVRISLNGGSKIENKDGDVIGINVSARIMKNKVAPPHKKVEFQIHFGKGIVEHEELFDRLREAGAQSANGKEITVSGDGAWKLLKVVDESSQMTIIEKKFIKSQFGELMNDSTYGPYIEDAIEKALVTHQMVSLSAAAEADENTPAEEIES